MSADWKPAEIETCQSPAGASESGLEEFIRDAGFESRQAFWQAVQHNIRDGMGQERFSIWFKQTKLMSVQGNSLVVGTANLIVQQFLAARYSGAVESAVEELVGRRLSVTFDVAPELFREARAQRRAEAQELAGDEVLRTVHSDPAPVRGRVPADWGFDRLIVTRSNRLPVAAARELAGQENPRFRFLYICGGYGLGKSAVLRSVYAMASAPERGLSPLYVSAEDWCADYYHAIQLKSTRPFRNKYRSTSMLVMDDLQFVQGREGCQRELVHTVKAILDAGGRVALAGKPSPEELQEVTDAFRALMRKAFPAGLVQPREEERVQIVRELAARRGLGATEEVHEFIARSRGECMASMEAAVSGLALYAGLDGHQKVALPMALEALAALIPPTPLRRASLEDVRDAVTDTYGVSAHDMAGRSRARSICQARHVAMFLSKKLTGASLAEIARFYGKSSHSTVKHAICKIDEMIRDDDHLAGIVSRIENRLTAPD